MTPKVLITSALLACAMLAITAVDASARGWGRGGYGGAFGHYYGRSFHAPGWSHSAIVSRMPARYRVTRSFQTPSGRGATRTFNRGCSGGTCQRKRDEFRNDLVAPGSVTASGTGTCEPHSVDNRPYRRRDTAATARQLHVRRGAAQRVRRGHRRADAEGGSHDDAERCTAKLRITPRRSPDPPARRRDRSRSRRSKADAYSSRAGD